MDVPPSVPPAAVECAARRPAVGCGGGGSPSRYNNVVPPAAWGVPPGVLPAGVAAASRRRVTASRLRLSACRSASRLRVWRRRLAVALLHPSCGLGCAARRPAVV